MRRARPVLLVTTALFAAALSTQPRAHASGDYTTSCPKAESLVPNATWHRHTLMNGVVLSEAQAKDPRGVVDMHVLTVDMTNTAIHFHPLMHHIAQRTALSQLAGGHPKLVAATNTGYFDFGIGAPYGPVVARRLPITATLAKRAVVGIGTDHRVYTGHVWLAASVTVNGVTKPLAGFNSITVPTGISVYTAKWGSTSVPVPSSGVSRYVSNGVISSGTHRYTSPPQSGSWMLVARGSTAVNWLQSASRGTKVRRHLGVKSDTPVTLSQAYAVGAAMVQQKGVVRTGLPCRTRYPLPARNAVGWSNGHRKLIIAVVTDKPGTSMHGLDENQMSKLMVELGAVCANLWDGSGSAEMIARMPRTGALSIRNYPADGGERLMPVGFGIFRH
jgi:hypothetical protein